MITASLRTLRIEQVLEWTARRTRRAENDLGRAAFTQPWPLSATICKKHFRLWNCATAP